MPGAGYRLGADTASLPARPPSASNAAFHCAYGSGSGEAVLTVATDTAWGETDATGVGCG